MALKPINLTGEQQKVLFLPVKEPIQIKGVAGSGKTSVAIYRAKHLLDTQSNLFQEAKVAIFTYNKTLVRYIKAVTNQIGMNITVTTFHSWAYRFLKDNGIDISGRVVSNETQKLLIEKSKAKFCPYNLNISNKSAEFFLEEISWIKGKIFKNKEEYLEARRVGRGRTDRITKADKEIIWSMYEDYCDQLIKNGYIDFDDYALLCLYIIDTIPNFQKPFTHIVVDEAQDLSKAQILVISKLVSDETKSITIIADAAQRIYKSGFNWSEVGLNVRGARTVVLKNNYRNTKQIAFAAKSLLDKEEDKEEFEEIIPVRGGNYKPVVGYFKNKNEQNSYLLNELNQLKADGYIKSTVILHRNRGELEQIQLFLSENNFEAQIIQDSNGIDFYGNSIKICTMSSVKGLEFDNVFIIDLNDDIIPYPKGFADSNDIYHISTERRLLYTCMTRARERLYLLSSGNPSRYLLEIDKEYVDIININDFMIFDEGIVDELPF